MNSCDELVVGKSNKGTHVTKEYKLKVHENCTNCTVRL